MNSITSLWTPIILLHTAFAVGALLLGGFVLFRPKGNAAHRLAGRIWVMMMATIALSSFAIKTSGSFSWIHGLSIFVLFGLVWAIRMARLKNIKEHQGWMKGLYFYSLIIAGLFTLMPGRLISRTVMQLFN